jgi:hypothetical protein
MTNVLLRGRGGEVSLPDPRTIMVDRRDGGQLVVHPPRRVWDRTALTPPELAAWTVLVAAAARAMLEQLPQLEGGCLNYWDAGNWALTDAAEPEGPKSGPLHRVLHLHLLGRSPRADDPDWRWGEAPVYPAFADRFSWSRTKAALTAEECAAIVARARAVLRSVYEVAPDDVAPGGTCASCRYPSPLTLLDGEGRCPECTAPASP